MQGFILHTQKVKDEDLIVYILSTRAILKTYRFYGLRHSSILNGYKIDFSLDENPNFLPRLKDVLHLGFGWIMQREIMLVWQDFMRLLYMHLKDIEELDEFYFKLLNECVTRLFKQDAKRVIIDAYIKLLAYEGRLAYTPNLVFRCFACESKLSGEIVLLRAFLTSCENCAFKNKFSESKIRDFFQNLNCSVFSDEEIEKIYAIVKDGL